MKKKESDNIEELSKKEQAEKDRALREANHVEHAFHFEVHGVRQVKVALYFIPWLKKMIIACCVTSIFLTGLSVWEYFNRNPAMLFLSMPDGSLRCPLATFDIQTKKVYQRPAEYEALCVKFQGKNVVLSDKPEPEQPQKNGFTPIEDSAESQSAESQNEGSLSTTTFAPDQPNVMSEEDNGIQNPTVAPSMPADGASQVPVVIDPLSVPSQLQEVPATTSDVSESEQLNQGVQ